MSSSQKKVIVRCFGGDLRSGYLPVSGFVRAGLLSLLDLDGRQAAIPLADVKTVCYVRDFNLNDRETPERLQRRAFLARPRGDGLWVRLTFRTSADVLEGLAAADLSLLDSMAEDDGLQLIPPDIRGNTQRIFVPRSAIASLTLLAVVSSPSRRGAARPLVADPVKDADVQKRLFPS